MTDDEKVGAAAIMALSRVLDGIDAPLAAYLRAGLHVLPDAARATGASPVAEEIAAALLTGQFKLAHQEAYTHLDGQLKISHPGWTKQQRLQQIAAQHSEWFSPSLAPKNDERLRRKPRAQERLRSTARAANKSKADRDRLPEDAAKVEMDTVMRENRERDARVLPRITVWDLRKRR